MMALNTKNGNYNWVDPMQYLLLSDMWESTVVKHSIGPADWDSRKGD